MGANKVQRAYTPQTTTDSVSCGFLLDNLSDIFYHIDMLSGIRIYASDTVWRQILGDFGATVLDAPTATDINFDDFNITDVISLMELKSLILNAADLSADLIKIFGKNVTLPQLQARIVVWLYKSGGMTALELKNALGYAPDASTHTVDTAIYQLRRMYGRDFIQNNNGVYSIGKL